MRLVQSVLQQLPVLLLQALLRLVLSWLTVQQKL